LTADVWQRRFHADPMVRSASLLLHERIPRRLELQDTQPSRSDEARSASDVERAAVREFDTPDTVQPHVALLGRAPYTIMVSHAGGGYSRFEDLAVTRWRADGTRDHSGQFCYLKDITRGAMWTARIRPSGISSSRRSGMHGARRSRPFVVRVRPTSDRSGVSTSSIPVWS